MGELPERIRKAVAERGLERCLMEVPLVVGVSGGPDSLALLHVLCALRGPLGAATLHVAHLDHGFRGQAGEQDAAFVRERARELGLACTVERFDVPSFARGRGLSDEEAARRVRYAFLGGLGAKLGAHVAVAHSADDQAETVLMNLLRGTGVSGLGGMQMLGSLPVAVDGEESRRQQAEGSKQKAEIASSLLPTAYCLLPTGPRSPVPILLFRPLLGVWRREIEEYCAQLGLQPRVDATNTELNHTRNRIRRELIPLLEREYSPAIRKHLYDLSEIASEEDSLLDRLARDEAGRIALAGEDGSAVRLDRAELAGLPLALGRRVVRWALEAVAGTLEGITFEHTEQALRVLVGGEDGPRAADLPHAVTVARRGDVSLAYRREEGAGGPERWARDGAKYPVMERGCAIALEVGQSVDLDAGWRLESAVKDASDVDVHEASELLAMFDLDALGGMGPLVARTRRPGDFIRPLGMEGRKSLQDLFVDAKIPVWARDYLPVIALAEDGGEVLWAPGEGGRRSAHAPVEAGTRRVLRLKFVRTGGGPDGSAGP